MKIKDMLNKICVFRTNSKRRNRMRFVDGGSDWFWSALTDEQRQEIRDNKMMIIEDEFHK